MSRNGVRKPVADPISRARFRETARKIVAKDRYDRKYGFTVDTAGAVARAMERAYRDGFEDAQLASPASAANTASALGAPDWALIPPRPRAAFWTICLFTLGKGDQVVGAGYLVPAATGRGTPGWRLVGSSRSFERQPFGEKTILPLLRLGLLARAVDGPERLLVSAVGRVTWWRFLERGGQFPEDLKVGS